MYVHSYTYTSNPHKINANKYKGSFCVRKHFTQLLVYKELINTNNTHTRYHFIRVCTNQVNKLKNSHERKDNDIMYINNDELDLMIKIENLVGCNLSLLFPNDEPFKMKNYDGSYTILTKEEFNDYWNLIERLINAKKKRNEKQAQVTRERRKIDPLYGRSKKEKERIQRKTIDTI